MHLVFLLPHRLTVGLCPFLRRSLGGQQSHDLAAHDDPIPLDLQFVGLLGDDVGDFLDDLLDCSRSCRLVGVLVGKGKGRER